MGTLNLVCHPQGRYPLVGAVTVFFIVDRRTKQGVAGRAFSLIRVDDNAYFHQSTNGVTATVQKLIDNITKLPTFFALSGTYNQ